MSNAKIIQNYYAETAIAPNRIVKHGSTDDYVVQATAATEAICGVSTYITVAAGERVDIVSSGIAEVEFGGTVTRGGAVTSDASGKAVAAAPAAGTNNRIIGFALVSAVAGDISVIRISPNQIQG